MIAAYNPGQKPWNSLCKWAPPSHFQCCFWHQAPKCFTTVNTEWGSGVFQGIVAAVVALKYCFQQGKRIAKENNAARFKGFQMRKWLSVCSDQQKVAVRMRWPFQGVVGFVVVNYSEIILPSVRGSSTFPATKNNNWYMSVYALLHNCGDLFPIYRFIAFHAKCNRTFLLL